MFTNIRVGDYTYATRFIASWVREGGQLRTGKDQDDFREWLESLGISENEVEQICFLATNGKLELEVSARAFINNLNK